MKPAILKYIVLSLLSLAFMNGVFCQTLVPYNILTPTTWSKSGSPYLVKNTVNIAPGVVVSIEPGARIEFYENGGIQLFGEMLAKGTASDSITFIFSGKQDNSIDYTSISLNKGCSFELNFCAVKNHFYFVDDNNSGTNIHISNSYFLSNTFSFTGSTNNNLITVKNCKFVNNAKCISKMFVSIDSTEFVNNKTSLSAIRGIISHSNFTRSDIAAIKDPMGLYVDSCTFKNNYIAIQHKSEQQTITLKDNIIADNTIGLQISGNTLPSTILADNNLFDNELYNIDNQSTLKFDFNNNCWGSADTAAIFVSIHSIPYLNFQPLHVSCRGCKPKLQVIFDSVCVGSPFEIVLVNKGESPNEKYQWFPSSFLFSNDNADAKGKLEDDTLTSIEKIDFKIVLTNNTCQDSATASVYFYPKDDRHCRNCSGINAGKDTTICSGDKIVLGTTTSNAYFQFSWFPTEGLTNSLIENPEFYSENKSRESVVRTFALTVVDSEANCVNSDSVIISILSEYNNLCKGLPEIHVYNVITPNGDGQNQNFHIDNIEFYPQNDVSVYNRWGNQVMHKRNYKNDWDGNNLADGVYYYIVSIPEISQEFKGDLTIKK